MQEFTKQDLIAAKQMINRNKIPAKELSFIPDDTPIVDELTRHGLNDFTRLLDAKFRECYLRYLEGTKQILIDLLGSEEAIVQACVNRDLLKYIPPQGETNVIEMTIYQGKVISEFKIVGMMNPD